MQGGTYGHTKNRAYELDGTAAGRGRAAARERNRTLAPIANQLPLCTDLFEEMLLAKFVSAYDITDGYWQCGLADDGSIGLTAFQSEAGQFEWLCLPQGMSVSGPYFQGWISRILAKYRTLSTQVRPATIEQEKAANSIARDISEQLKEKSELSCGPGYMSSAMRHRYRIDDSGRILQGEIHRSASQAVRHLRTVERCRKSARFHHFPDSTN